MTFFSLPILGQEILDQDNLEELEAEITKKWEAFRNSELSTIQDTLTKKFATWTEP